MTLDVQVLASVLFQRLTLAFEHHTPQRSARLRQNREQLETIRDRQVAAFSAISKLEQTLKDAISMKQATKKTYGALFKLVKLGLFAA